MAALRLLFPLNQLFLLAESGCSWKSNFLSVISISCTDIARQDGLLQFFLAPVGARAEEAINSARSHSFYRGDGRLQITTQKLLLGF